MALKVCLLLLKNNYTFSWVSLLFIQSLTLGLASGALWSAQAFWVLMMLLFAIYNKRLKLKQQTSLNNKFERALQL
jgi:Flp pilus assembly protein TadB